MTPTVAEVLTLEDFMGVLTVKAWPLASESMPGTPTPDKDHGALMTYQSMLHYLNEIMRNSIGSAWDEYKQLKAMLNRVELFYAQRYLEYRSQTRTEV